MKTIHLEAKAVTAAVLALLLAGCGQEGKQGAAAPGAGSAPPPPEVTVVTVGKTEADLTQDLPGRLEAYRVAQVRARVDGIVEKRLFTEGSDVKAGATLFQIDPRSYRAAYAAARADAEVAKQTRDRYQQLLDVKAVSQQDYDLAVAKLRAAEAALARARAGPGKHQRARAHFGAHRARTGDRGRPGRPWRGDQPRRHRADRPDLRQFHPAGRGRNAPEERGGLRQAQAQRLGCGRARAGRRQHLSGKGQAAVFRPGG